MLATNALTTVQKVEDAYGSGASTSRVETVINAVSARVERHCGRQFAYFVYPLSAPEFYQGTGELDLYLRRWPIVDVAQVRLDLQPLNVINDPSGILYQLGFGDVQRTPERDRKGKLYRYSGWPMIVPTFYDLTQNANTDPIGRRWNVDVAYTGGYVLPQFRQSGTIASSSANVTGLVDTSNLQVGYQVTGTGIPTGTTVASITGATTLTLSQDATLSTTSTLYFDPISPVLLTVRPAPIVQSGTLTAGSAVITGLASTTDIPIGTPVVRSPLSAYVTEIVSGTSVRINTLSTLSGTYSLTFSPAATAGAELVPGDLEEAVINEVVRRLARPVPGLVSERTAGGWQQTFEAKDLDAIGDFDRGNLRTFDRYAGEKRWFA